MIHEVYKCIYYVEIDCKAMHSSICRACEYKEKCSDIRNCVRFEKII